MDLYKLEKDEIEEGEEGEGVEQVISKFLILFIRDLLINYRFIDLEKG
jgi:hypothetical protein